MRTKHPTPFGALTLGLCLLSLVGLGAVAGCSPGDAEARAEQAEQDERAKPDPAPGEGSAAAPARASADSFPDGPYADRDPALAKQLVERGALLLDVRSAAEFGGGHLDGAVHIDHREVGERVDEIAEFQGGDRHEPIVLYCRSGRRAELAKRELEAAGFDRVTNLGGMSDWPNSSH